MWVGLVFCYTQPCADKTAGVMKTLESGKPEGFTAALVT